MGAPPSATAGQFQFRQRVSPIRGNESCRAEEVLVQAVLDSGATGLSDEGITTYKREERIQSQG